MQYLRVKKERQIIVIDLITKTDLSKICIKRCIKKTENTVRQFSFKRSFNLKQGLYSGIEISSVKSFF